MAKYTAKTMEPMGSMKFEKTMHNQPMHVAMMGKTAKMGKGMMQGPMKKGR